MEAKKPVRWISATIFYAKVSLYTCQTAHMRWLAKLYPSLICRSRS